MNPHPGRKALRTAQMQWLKLELRRWYENVTGVVAGALLVIPMVYYILPNSTPKEITHGFEEITKVNESTDSEETTEVHENSKLMETTKGDGNPENAEKTTVHENSKIMESAEGDGNPENDFCREFKSKGVFIKRNNRERRPGMLREVSEIAVADGSIFFLETSCAKDLNPRQSCAIESAARAHPEKQIYVLLISPEASEGSEGEYNIGKLKSIYANINVYYIDIFSYTERTKMEKWVENQRLMTSSFKVAHLSDGLRLLTLCKYGGIYLIWM
ncbi:hypothetical protein J437_LFUL019004 [Ladona fulva]|uniref:Uncharacterized protein n=1 Tax=Ladona fulva TaxID=123851 RepID=A0A8K0KPT8_LADFU|nr:hypothetical protein J437_LFUL019004 [Ladona fulva]